MEALEHKLAEAAEAAAAREQQAAAGHAAEAAALREQLVALQRQLDSLGEFQQRRYGVVLSCRWLGVPLA